MALGNKWPFHAGSMNLEQTGTVKTETNSLAHNLQGKRDSKTIYDRVLVFPT